MFSKFEWGDVFGEGGGGLKGAEQVAGVRWASVSLPTFTLQSSGHIVESVENYQAQHGMPSVVTRLKANRLT